MAKTKRVPRAKPVHVDDEDDFEGVDEDEGEGLQNADTVALLGELKAMAEIIVAQVTDHGVASLQAQAIVDRIAAVLNPPAPVPAPDPAPPTV